MNTFVVFLTSLLFTIAITPLVEMTQTYFGWLRPNYRGEILPFAAGIHVPLIASAGAFLLVNERRLALSFAVLICGFTILGLLDDLYGDRSVGGFLGHFSKLFREKTLTTGVVKAIGGGILSLFAAMSISMSFSGIIVGTLIIALSANFCNLMDVRPGRAIKGFFVLSLLYLIMVRITVDAGLAALMMGIATGLLYFDLRESMMLGDTGTGTIGASIGFIMALSLDMPAKIIVAVLLVALHALSERFSISKLIEANRLLLAIDNFGRRPLS